MSYATWNLGCAASLQQTTNPALVRSTIEDGYPKVRRRFTKSWRTYQVSWRLDWSAFNAFWAFYTQDCGDGSIPFYLSHPITKENLLVRWVSPPTTQADPSTKPVFVVNGELEEVFS